MVNRPAGDRFPSTPRDCLQPVSDQGLCIAATATIGRRPRHPISHAMS